MPFPATTALSTWHQCSLRDTWRGALAASAEAPFAKSALPSIRTWLDNSDSKSASHRFSCSEEGRTNKEAPRHDMWSKRTRPGLAAGRIKPPPRLFFTTNVGDMDTLEVSQLLSSVHRNCDSDPESDPESVLKWNRALHHSIVSVAVYVPSGASTTERRRLVGFGRAISDTTLTASIHDLVNSACEVKESRGVRLLVVYSLSLNLDALLSSRDQIAPDFQQQGLGKQVLHRILKDLRKRGILDIAVITPDVLTNFFGRQGFEADRMESVTMVYNATNHSRPNSSQSSHSPHLVRASESSTIEQ